MDYMKSTFEKVCQIVQVKRERVLRSDPHMDKMRPIVFQHIPKTAGDSIRRLLITHFGPLVTFPYMNPDDWQSKDIFEKISSEQKLFMGHMKWDSVCTIKEKVPGKMRVITSLREPVSQARSHVAFRKTLYERGWLKDLSYTQIEELDQPLEQYPCENQVSLVNFQVDYLNVRKNTEPFSSEKFNITTRLNQIDHPIIKEKLQESIDLLCYDLRLPASDTAGIVTNSSGVGHTFADQDPKVKELKERCPSAFQFYEKALAKHEYMNEKYLRSVSNKNETLNRRYRLAVANASPMVSRVDLRPGKSWPGIGWGYVRGKETPKVLWDTDEWVRPLLPDRPADIMVCLQPNRDYVIALNVHNANGYDNFSGVTAGVDGEPLEPGESVLQKGLALRRWKLPRERVSGGVQTVEFSIVHVDSQQPMTIRGVTIDPL